MVKISYLISLQKIGFIKKKVSPQKIRWNLLRVEIPEHILSMNKSSDTTNITTRPCGELWWVKRWWWVHIATPFHQPQLGT